MIAILARREGRRVLPSCGDGRREGGSEGGRCNIGCVCMCWNMKMPVRTRIWTAGRETDAMAESRGAVWGERERTGGPWRVYEVFDFHRMRVLHNHTCPQSPIIITGTTFFRQI